MRTLESAKLDRQEQQSVLEAARILKSALPVSRVILFSSKARGTAEPDSDIDILVLTSCPVTTELRTVVSNQLAQINLDNDVELSSVVVSEQDWSDGIIRCMLIHNEVEQNGCEV